MKKIGKIIIILVSLCFTTNQSLAAEYEVINPGTPVRWNLWAGEGLVYLKSSNNSWGNRLRLGAEVHFTPNYRWLFGFTLFDFISTGENSPEILGDLSREAMSFDLGYFLVADKLWLKYSLALGDVSASNITGPVGITGHGLSLGYRVYDQNKFNIGIELSYLYFLMSRANYFDPLFNTFATATYPHANIVSLNVRFGFDIGGR